MKIKVAFLKSADANPYYFSSKQLKNALNMMREMKKSSETEDFFVSFNLEGGHRNKTGYDAVLTVETSAESKIREIIDLWKSRADIKVLMEI